MNGQRIIVNDRNKVMFIPLPREVWRKIDKGCACQWCSSDAKVPGEAYWDTLVVPIPGKKGYLRASQTHTWTCHAPEYHGIRPQREN